jgi:hypothetical protein
LKAENPTCQDCVWWRPWKYRGLVPVSGGCGFPLGYENVRRAKGGRGRCLEFRRRG